MSTIVGVRRRIRAELGRREMSQADLALHLQMSQQALSRRMRGHVSFTVDELEAVAEAVHVPVQELLKDDGEEEV